MITKSAYNRFSFIMYRRVQNEFDFLLRDIDRQPVVLDGTVVFHMWDDQANLIYEKTLTVVNAPRAQYHLTVTADETVPIYSGLYVWAVTNIDTSVEKLLYTNSDYGAKGIIQVDEGILVPPVDPYVILGTDLTPLMPFSYSSTFPGAARSENPAGNHSLIVYLDNTFTGTVKVQATLDETSPTDDSQWVDVLSTNFTALSTPQALSFSGNFTYVRFLASSVQGLLKLVYSS